MDVVSASWIRIDTSHPIVGLGSWWTEGFSTSLVLHPDILHAILLLDVDRAATMAVLAGAASLVWLPSSLVLFLALKRSLSLHRVQQRIICLILRSLVEVNVIIIILIPLALATHFGILRVLPVLCLGAARLLKRIGHRRSHLAHDLLSFLALQWIGALVDVHEVASTVVDFHHHILLARISILLCILSALGLWLHVLVVIIAPPSRLNSVVVASVTVGVLIAHIQVATPLTILSGVCGLTVTHSLI